jgi:glycosyltransferase involved in cell wall biosynthesis
VRLTVVMTHPVQYYAPWFRQIAAQAPELSLSVVYAVRPAGEQQGVGYDRAFTWDVPLTAGYDATVVRDARGGEHVGTGRFFGLNVPEVVDAMLRTRPDVVMIAGWYSITLVRALVACRRRGIPVLWRGDSNRTSGGRGWKRALRSISSRLLLRWFDGFLSPGRRVDEYLRHFGAPAYRIFEVPYAVDPASFIPPVGKTVDARLESRRALGITDGAFVPLFVGRFVDSKRPLDLVAAAAGTAAPVHLLMAGSGPLEAAIRDEATRRDVRVTLPGFVNQSGLAAIYAAADCLVLPSDSRETWGLVVNEALAAGLPVIVSSEAGCAPDLVREDTGRTFATGDVRALAAAIDSVRREAESGRDWASSCRRLASAHSYQAATRGLVRAARSVLRHSVGAPEIGAGTRILACFGQMVIVGGLERMSFSVLRTMRERGASVHCIVNSWENHRITPIAESLGASWSAGPYWYPLTRRVTPSRSWRMIRETQRVSVHLLREARRIRPTHVFIPDFQTLLRNVPALVFLRARGARVVMRLGNAPESGRFYRRLWRWAIAPFVDTFVCNSRFSARELLSHDVPAGKVLQIDNALIDDDREAAPEWCPLPGRVVFVGQIIPEKGVDLLLDAVAILRHEGLEVTADIVGDMDGWESPRSAGYRRGLRDRAALPDLAGAVRFTGWRDDVAAALASAAVHCCPSRPEQREGFGNVVLEAKRVGVPSVVGPSGNLLELVRHQEDGWICETPTAEAVAEGLRYFVTQPAAVAAAGRAARASASRFSPQAFRESWAQVFA